MAPKSIYLRVMSNLRFLNSGNNITLSTNPENGQKNYERKKRRFDREKTEGPKIPRMRIAYWGL